MLNQSITPTSTDTSFNNPGYIEEIRDLNALPDPKTRLHDVKNLIQCQLIERDRCEKAADNATNPEADTVSMNALHACEKELRKLYTELEILEAKVKNPLPSNEFYVAQQQSSSLALASDAENLWGVNRSLLPLLQWHYPKNCGTVDKKQHIFEDPAEALQSLEWRLSPPLADKNLIDGIWAQYIENCMNFEQANWFRSTFITSVGSLTGVSWRQFVGAFLDRFTRKSYLYKPLDNLLEYTNIKMDPSRETFEKYFIRFRKARDAANQSDNELSAALLLESLPITLKTKAKEIFTIDPKSGNLDNCVRTEMFINRVIPLAYNTVTPKKDVMSPLFTPQFFRNADLCYVLKPIDENPKKPMQKAKQKQTAKLDKYPKTQDTLNKPIAQKNSKPSKHNQDGMSNKRFAAAENSSKPTRSSSYVTRTIYKDSRSDRTKHCTEAVDYNRRDHSESSTPLKRRLDEYMSLVNTFDKRISPS